MSALQCWGVGCARRDGRRGVQIGAIAVAIGAITTIKVTKINGAIGTIGDVGAIGGNDGIGGRGGAVMGVLCERALLVGRQSCFFVGSVLRKAVVSANDVDSSIPDVVKKRVRQQLCSRVKLLFFRQCEFEVSLNRVLGFILDIWDLNEGVGRQLCSLTGHSGRVLSVAFTPDSKRVVSGS